MPERLDDGCGVVLRPVREDDAEILVAWLVDPAVHRGWGGRPLDVEEVRAKYTGRRAPAVLSWIVERDGTPSGYVQAWHRSGRHGIDMFVAAAAQGRGTGRRAAALLADHLDRRGWQPLTVDPVADDLAAVRFWTTAGFVPAVGADDGAPISPGHLLMTWAGRPNC